MSPMYSVRADFDSYFHWGVFIFVAAFMTYFLTSMISLANMEDEQNNAVISIGYAPRSSYLQHRGETISKAITTEEAH